MYPLFIFPINKTRFFMFNNGFNEDVINKATALALIGYQFFVLGLLSYRQSRNRKNKNNPKPKIKTQRKVGKTFDYIDILLFSFFIVFLSTLFYHTANRAKSEFVREYDTVITEVSYGRWGNTAWFTDPDLKEQTIDFIDWKIVYNDDQDGVAKGDEELDAELLAAKISKLRIFSDENDKINKDLKRALINKWKESSRWSMYKNNHYK